MSRAVCTLAVLFFSCFSAFAEPSIDWRVKHPFRFFTETRDFDMHRAALAGVVGSATALPADVVSKLEGKVNDVTWLRGWYDANPGLYPDAAGAGRPQQGWGHPIHQRRATCWDWREQWHSSCQSDTFGQTRRTDYVLPQRHTVTLSVLEAPAGACTWNADLNLFIAGTSTLSMTMTRPCTDPVEARIPFEPGKAEAERGVDVRVTLPDGTVLRQSKLWVRDRLIVGIGDSFSSGEGNPDTPAQIAANSHTWRVNPAFYYDSDDQAIRSTAGFSPVRGDNPPAGWLDRKCHRSVYSYHLRTALQVAMADVKHSAVTFLGYACSGAELTEGLLLPYKGVEPVDDGLMLPDGRKRRNLSQIDRLMIELCREDLVVTGRKRTLTLTQPVTKPNGGKISSVTLYDCPASQFLRPIDMLIVSIGGNDVGFSSLITYVLTRVSAPTAGLIGKLPGLNDIIPVLSPVIGAHGVDKAEVKAKELPARFAALRQALAPIPIARTGGRPNVILTAFPKIEYNQNGKLCGLQDDREVLEGTNIRGLLMIDKITLAQVSTFANDVLFPATRAAAAAGNWRFVDAHRDVFQNHGVCAQDRAAPISAAEEMMLPYRYPAQARWYGFDPTKAEPYAPRQRWYRTMVDAYMLVQFWEKGSPPGKGKWGKLDLLTVTRGGGPFHPTAQGHAHIADAVYAQAKAMLGLPEPSVEDLMAR